MDEETVGMPVLLRVAMALGAVFGIFGTAAGLGGVTLVLRGDLDPAVGGEAPALDPVALALPFLMLYVLACLTAGAASWSLFKRRARSRALLTVLLVEFVIGDAAMLVMARRVFDAGAGELAGSVVLFTVLVALGLWYLYGKESVQRYYRSLAR